MAPSIMEPAIAFSTELKHSESITASKSTQNHEEHQYLDLIREILETGEYRPDRYSSRHIKTQITIN